MRADNDNYIGFNKVALGFPDFTANEKTLLGDIAMKFRDEGISTNIELIGFASVPGVKFFDRFQEKSFFLFVTRYETESLPIYQVSPKCGPVETFINFADVLISCRKHVAHQSRKPAEIISMVLGVK